jgi:hypothetical protein
VASALYLSFPQLQAGERKLLVDALIAQVEIGKNKRVTGVLRPPFCSFGYLSARVAPRGIEPIHRFRIFLEHTPAGYDELTPSGELIAYANPTAEKYFVVGHSQLTLYVGSNPG